MKKTLIVLIDLFFILSSIAVFSFAFDDFHISLILLASVFLLGGITVSYLLIKEIVLGEKTYNFSDSKLYLYQKGKLKYAFDKNTIEDIILIFGLLRTFSGILIVSKTISSLIGDLVILSIAGPLNTPCVQQA